MLVINEGKDSSMGMTYGSRVREDGYKEGRGESTNSNQVNGLIK